MRENRRSGDVCARNAVFYAGKSISGRVWQAHGWILRECGCNCGILTDKQNFSRLDNIYTGEWWNWCENGNILGFSRRNNQFFAKFIEKIKEMNGDDIKNVKIKNFWEKKQVVQNSL